jgi:hypothetical protein
MGSWDNPPSDIMTSPFFDGIEWDSIYERHQDGPYVPELPYFLNGRKNSINKVTSSKETVNATTTTEETLLHTPTAGGITNSSSLETPKKTPFKQIVFTPPPFHRVTNNPEEANKEVANPPAIYPNKEEAEGDDEDEEEEEESEEEAELPMMRDSVFIFSTGGQNKLPDWSYIDEAVLAEYLTAEQNQKNASADSTADKSEKKKSKKSKKSETVSGEGTTLTDGATNETDTPAPPVDTTTIETTTVAEVEVQQQTPVTQPEPEPEVLDSAIVTEQPQELTSQEDA